MNPARRRPPSPKLQDPREEWRRAEAKAKREELEALFAQQVHACRLPAPQREHLFHPERKWRFDFAWPDFKVAVEIDGGTHDGAARGRHVRGEGFERDAEKLNQAQSLGWRVFRYTSRMVRSGVAVVDVAVQLERAAWGVSR